MIKRTVLLAKPMYVSLKLSQLKLENSNGEHITTPIEDLGAVIVDHPQVKISTPAITELLAKNVNLILLSVGILSKSFYSQTTTMSKTICIHGVILSKSFYSQTTTS